MPPAVLLIGTGRLAFHLGHALHKAGFTIAGVTGRNREKADLLAKDIGSCGFGWNTALPPADLRVIAVSDDAIGPVADGLPTDGTPVAHLSGSKSLDLLKAHGHRGVLWPIQSFSPGAPVSFAGVPLVIDAADDHTLTLLRNVAGKLSSAVVPLPFPQRQRLHLSAVLAANFPIFLLREAERLLKARDIDPTLLHPLWVSATARAMGHADQAVTGPARRGDLETIGQQLALLADEPELRHAYAALSNLILHTYHPGLRGKQDL